MTGGEHARRRLCREADVGKDGAGAVVLRHGPPAGAVVVLAEESVAHQLVVGDGTTPAGAAVARSKASTAKGKRLSFWRKQRNRTPPRTHADIAPCDSAGSCAGHDAGGQVGGDQAAAGAARLVEQDEDAAGRVVDPDAAPAGGPRGSIAVSCRRPAGLGPVQQPAVLRRRDQTVPRGRRRVPRVDHVRQEQRERLGRRGSRAGRGRSPSTRSGVPAGPFDARPAAGRRIASSDSSASRTGLRPARLRAARVNCPSRPTAATYTPGRPPPRSSRRTRGSASTSGWVTSSASVRPSSRSARRSRTASDSPGCGDASRPAEQCDQAGAGS